MTPYDAAYFIREDLKKTGDAWTITAFRKTFIDKFEIRRTHDACIKPYVVLTNGASFLKTRKDLIAFLVDLNKYPRIEIKIYPNNKRTA